MQSDATSVEAYLAQLPNDRRSDISAVRKLLLANLDPAFEEGMLYGMIGYYVPHSLFPAGYHCDPKQPLSFCALASQKNYMSLYVMTLYGDVDHLKKFKDDWSKSGKKLDMGKCCIRFRKLDDLDLNAVANAVGRVRAKEYIAHYQRTLDAMKSTKKAVKTTKKAVKSTTPTAGTKKVVKKASTKGATKVKAINKKKTG